jgi:methionyl-tRNA synthetase
MSSEEGKSVPSALVSLEEFQRVSLRVGTVLAAQAHPNADRLLVLHVDLGEGTPRQLVAGIKGSYTAEELVGKHVLVVANLKPATIRGVESQGMVLAAQDSSHLALLVPDRPTQAGSVIK